MSASKTNEWKLGLFVVAGVVFAVGTLFWLGARKFNREVVRRVTFFDESVQGLEVGSPVKMRGVTIGTVSNITIARDQRLVEVHANLYRNVLARLGIAPLDHSEGEVAVPAGLRVQLASVGITGVKFLLVDFFDEQAYPPPELPFDPPPGYVPSAESTLKSLEDGVTVLVGEIPEAIEQIRLLAVAVRDGIEKLDVEGLASRGKQLIERLDERFTSFETADKSTQIDRFLTDANSAVQSFKRVLAILELGDGSLTDALANWNSLMTELERTVAEAQLGETTASVRDGSDAIRGIATEAGVLTIELNQDLIVFREALEALRALADYLERDPGALLRGRASETPVRK